MGRRARHSHRPHSPPALGQLPPIEALESSVGASEYLTAFGAMAPATDADAFWRALIKRHGKAASALRASIRSGGRGADARNRWDLKNASLALSLDVSVGYTGAMYLAQLDALASVRGLTSARRVIDVGCENGLVTLFAAIRCPEAEVIGLDTSHSAVDRARELAQLLGIGNATFIATDIREHEIGDPADVVLCSRVLTGESRADGVEGGFLLVDGLTLPESAPMATEIRAIGTLVGDSGQLVTTERLPGADDAWEFIAALAKGGFRPDWSASVWVEGHELGDRQRWPMIVASRAAESTRVEDLLSYWAPTREPLEEAAQHNDAAAELLFRQRAAGARVVAGFEIEYFEGGAERLELRLANGRAYGWKTTTRGFRRLVVQPAEHLPEMLEEAHDYAKQREAWGLVTEYGAQRPETAR